MEEEKEVHVHDAGVVAVDGNIYIEGTNVAGRDLFIENHILLTEWISVNLNAYTSDVYITPVFSDSLASRLNENRLLVLAGESEFDKEFFARHLAWRISMEFKLTKVLEKNSDDTSSKELAFRIRAENEQCIFILSDSSPKDIGFDLEMLRQAAAIQNHLIIITTDLGLHSWQLPPHQEKKYGFEIPAQGIYDQKTLTSVLTNQLNSVKTKLAFEDEISEFVEETLLPGGETVQSISKIFQSPQQIAFFIDLLSSEQQTLTASTLKDLILSFQDTSETLVSKWFRNLGSEKEKLLVVGAALLEGTYEDQFFEIMKLISETFWHHRAPSLQGLDYTDLDFLMPFFKFEDDAGRGAVLKSKFPSQRVEILYTAWRSHRRHIIGTIPILSKIVEQSRSTRFIKEAIYGNRHRRMILRIAITETFSDIGIIYLPAVEEKLLRLAATNDESLQRVAAKAIARWKFHGNSDKLFTLIGSWLKSDDINNRMIDILQESNPENHKSGLNNKARHYLYDVAILTLQYVIENEPPNQLPLQVVDLISFILNDPDQAQIEKLKAFIIQLLQTHFIQIKPLFAPSFIKSEKHSKLVVDGLQSVYEDHPKEVTEWLTEWFALCMSSNPTKSSFNRKLLLVTILRSYIRLHIGSQIHILNFIQIWEQIKELYIKETDSIIADLILKAIRELIKISPEQSLEHINFLFKYSTVDERYKIIGCFVSIYIEQRKNLALSGRLTVVRDVVVPYWHASDRPLTPIEETMYGWLNQGDSFSRDLAILNLSEFAIEFDKIEWNSVPFAKEDEEDTTLVENISNENIIFQSGSPRFPITLPEPHLSILSRIIIIFWLLFEKNEDKMMIKHLIRTMLQHSFVSDKEGIKMLIVNLRNRNTNRTIKIATWFKRLYGVH